MTEIFIIFVLLFGFFMVCLIGTFDNMNKTLQLMLRRQDESIRVLKNSRK